MFIMLKISSESGTMKKAFKNKRKVEKIYERYSRMIVKDHAGGSVYVYLIYNLNTRFSFPVHFMDFIC